MRDRAPITARPCQYQINDMTGTDPTKMVRAQYCAAGRALTDLVSSAPRRFRDALAYDRYENAPEICRIYVVEVPLHLRLQNASNVSSNLFDGLKDAQPDGSVKPMPRQMAGSFKYTVPSIIVITRICPGRPPIAARKIKCPEQDKLNALICDCAAD